MAPPVKPPGCRWTGARPSPLVPQPGEGHLNQPVDGGPRRQVGGRTERVQAVGRQLAGVDIRAYVTGPGRVGEQLGDEPVEPAVCLPGGVCTMDADATTLTIRVHAGDELSLRRIQGIVTRDLDRFSSREPLTVAWRPAEPAQ